MTEELVIREIRGDSDSRMTRFRGHYATMPSLDSAYLKFVLYIDEITHLYIHVHLALPVLARSGF